MTKYNSNFLGTVPFSDQTVKVALAATTALPYTIPGDNSIQYTAEFQLPYNANIWIGYNVTATLPTPGTATSSNRMELIRSGDRRYVRGGDVLSFISDTIVTNMGISLLQVPG